MTGAFERGDLFVTTVVLLIQDGSGWRRGRLCGIDGDVLLHPDTWMDHRSRLDLGFELVLVDTNDGAGSKRAKPLRCVKTAGFVGDINVLDTDCPAVIRVQQPPKRVFTAIHRGPETDLAAAEVRHNFGCLHILRLQVRHIHEISIQPRRFEHIPNVQADERPRLIVEQPHLRRHEKESREHWSRWCNRWVFKAHRHEGRAHDKERQMEATTPWLPLQVETKQKKGSNRAEQIDDQHA